MSTLTPKQQEILQQRAIDAMQNADVIRVAKILRFAPLDSLELKQAIRDAVNYGPSPEICAIFALSTKNSPDSDVVVEEIMEDTYLERVKCIHATQMTPMIVKYWNTPPK
jgi:hypothetical protein